MSYLTNLKNYSPIALAVLLAFNANADEQKDEIERIVVVGETTNAVLAPEDMEKFQANDLEDIFRQVPSVSVGGSVGIAQKVYIRGLEDTLLNVTVDGAPQTGTLFHHIGRVNIDPLLLEQVEVQAGAGEATSGAGAIGGAIRFKTKDADDLLEADEDFGALINGGYFSNDGYRGSVNLYGRLNQNWGLLGAYNYVDRDISQDGDGNDINGTASEQKLAFIKLSGDISHDQYLSLSYEKRDEEGEFNQRPNWPANADSTLYPIDSERETFVLNHGFSHNDYLNLETTLYYTSSQIVQNVFDRWGRYGSEIESYGFDVRNTSDIGDHSLTYGIEYRRDEVNSKGQDNPDAVNVKEEGDVTGIYLQDHWQLTSALLLSAGVRYDQYDLDQVTFGFSTDSDGVSPNVGLRYEFARDWELTLGYAEAMRGKEIGDGFTNEQGSSTRSTLADNLQPEEVDNTEIGLRYQGSQWHFVASAYQSNIDDVILDQLGGGVLYENAGKLETDGFEVAVGYWINGWELDLSYSTNDAEFNGHTVEGYEHIGLANARGDTWTFSGSYSPIDSIEFGWNYTIVEDLNDIEVLQRAVDLGWIPETQTIDKPGYDVLDVYVQWLPLESEQLQINLAVQNLLDEQYRDHSSVGDYTNIPGWDIVSGLYEPGRDIRLSISYQF